MYMALTDVADMALSDIVADMQRGYVDHTSVAERASLMDYGYAWERLRVNPTPQPDFDAWRIAQVHPYFVANVSDKTAELFAEHAPELIPVLEPMGVDTMVFLEINGEEVCARAAPHSVRPVGEPMEFTIDMSNMHLVDLGTDKVV